LARKEYEPCAKGSDRHLVTNEPIGSGTLATPNDAAEVIESDGDPPEPRHADTSPRAPLRARKSRRLKLVRDRCIYRTVESVGADTHIEAPRVVSAQTR
jgi:hypothetical protein